MKILMVGHGGREHALLHTLHHERPDTRFFITRGNAGTGAFAEAIPFAPSDTGGLGSWAEGNGVDLTIIGPEAPLADGMADAFQARGLAVFGPCRAAAAIEASKAWAKHLMQRAGVPTAAFATFTALEPALAFIRAHGPPLAVKASGLAAGKGVLLCHSLQDAEQAARAMLADARFGDAGREIVIEQFLEGEELSIFALTDGREALLMAPAQDHKRLLEGDRGPNTGGMGAYAPVSIASPSLVDAARNQVFLPILQALREAGATFRGLLYAGLMDTADGLRVIEFNARFGDPETQVVLPLLDAPLLDLMDAIARGGSLAGTALRWKPAAALTTVLASQGYPDSSSKGQPIHVPPALDSRSDVLVFHAGTRLLNGVPVTDGGRVLAVTGIAPSLEEAAALSRDAAAAIDFEGKQYRRDIGWRELERHARAS
jgi:phosphoribosylamine--glycine ligase